MRGALDSERRRLLASSCDVLCEVGRGQGDGAAPREASRNRAAPRTIVRDRSRGSRARRGRGKTREPPARAGPARRRRRRADGHRRAAGRRRPDRAGHARPGLLDQPQGDRPRARRHARRPDDDRRLRDDRVRRRRAGDGLVGRLGVAERPQRARDLRMGRARAPRGPRRSPQPIPRRAARAVSGWR